MQLKINVPLIDRITGIFTKSQEGHKIQRDQTSESSLAAAYYFKQMQLERTRKAKYGDYRVMDDDYVEVSSALDLYADNATKERDEEGSAFEIISEDPKAKNILGEMVDRTKLQEAMWDTAREIAKMGEAFDEVVVAEDELIVKTKSLQQETIFLQRDDQGGEPDKPYIQKHGETGSLIAEFERWQIVHWKNGGSKKMYGESILKPIRRVYKQLQMMEDGMVIGRLTRSHMRLKFLIDVEGMTPEEAEEHIANVKNSVKKKRMVNPYTGQLETAQNPLSAEEDLFLGVRKDSKADVDAIQGATNLGNIRDVEYFQNKLFAGLCPKAYLGFEKDVNAKATLTEQDIQFARRVSRIRKGLRAGLMQLGNTQLILLGVMPRKDLYKVKFAPISMVDEMRKWTMEKLKADVAKIYKVDVGILTDEYLLKHFVGVPDDEIEKLLAGSTGPREKGLAMSGTTGIRAGGLTGVASKGAVAIPKKMAAESGNGFHIASLQLMDLVETMRDLVSLELNG